MEGFSNDNSQASSSISNLLCQEDKSCLNEEENDEHKVGLQLLNSQFVPYNLDDDDDYDDDYFQLLIQKERSFSSDSSVSSSNYPSWLKDSRFLAINWILNTHKSFGFQNQTAYLSVIYLDRFLSRRFISENQSWAVVLLSVACLSLAAKLNECKVPALSAYQVENYAFKGNVIQEMELMVLATLDWKMSLITPFVYINYFIKKLGDQNSKQKELISRVIELIMVSIRESNSIEDSRSYIVAAAAVMAACDWQLTTEMLRAKIGTVTLWSTSDNKMEDSIGDLNLRANTFVVPFYLHPIVTFRLAIRRFGCEFKRMEEKQQEEEQLIAYFTQIQRICSKNNPGTPNLPEIDQRATPPSLAGRKRSLTFRDSNQDPNLPD